MSVIDAVGALPGGGEFVALWLQIEGDPGAVGDLGGLFRTGASELEHVGSGVDRSVAHVQDGWQGAAASSFTSYMGKMSTATSEVTSALDRASAQMRIAAQQLTEARTRMTQIAGQILDNYNAESEILRPLLARKYVDEGCTEARTVIDVLSSHLDSIAGVVTTAAEMDGYLPLHASGAHGYLPARGKPIRWTAIPKDGGTSPHGGGGGGGGGTTTTSPGTTSTPGPVSDSGGPKGPMPTGDVKDWIAQASKILEAHGIPASKLSPADINLIIQHESSGNPHAENLTDSNAAAGHPSKGLMQCIDSTFAAHALPGHTDIWNPVDNIIAGVRYAISRYGSLDNVPGVNAVHHGDPYVGY